MRSRRRSLRVLAAGSLLAAGALVLLPAIGWADEPIATGWWYQDVPLSGAPPQGATVTGQSVAQPVRAALAGRPASPTQVPPAPTPPLPPTTLPPLPVPTVPPGVTVPDPGGNVPTPTPPSDGGLLVANDVTGIRGISALRFDAPGAGGATLTLRLASGSTPSAGIVACPALSDWLPGPDQAWAARPAFDCDRVSVSASLSTDGTTMTWMLPDTFPNPDSPGYDVLLVPSGSDGTPFQVLFEKPTADAFTVTSPFAEEAPLPELALPDDLPPALDTFSADGFDVGGFDSGGSFLEEPAPSEVALPVAQRSAQTGGALQGLVDVLENPTVRRAATAMLVALGAYAYWQSNQAEQRSPRLLGALAGPAGLVSGAVLRPAVGRQRGIGRFARDRTERPPPL